MTLLFRIIGGLVIAAIGYQFVRRTEWLLQNIGAITWAEVKFASWGGTRGFYKLLGVGLIAIGFLLATGLLKGLLLATVGRLFVPPS